MRRRGGLNAKERLETREYALGARRRRDLWLGGLLLTSSGRISVATAEGHRRHPPSESAFSPHLLSRQSSSGIVNRTAVPGVISDSDSSSIGLACTLDEDCVRARQDGTFDRSSYCDELSATCVALGSVDSPCLTNSQCVSNTYCYSGFCSLPNTRTTLPVWVFVFPVLTGILLLLVIVLFYTWVRGIGIFRKVGPAQLPTITLHTTKPSAPDLMDFWHGARSPFGDDRRPKSPSSTLPRPHDVPEVAKGFSQEIKPSPLRRLIEVQRKSSVPEVTFIPDTIPGEEATPAKRAASKDGTRPIAILADGDVPKANGALLTYAEFSGNGKIPPSPPASSGVMPATPSWSFDRRTNDSDSWVGEDARELYDYPEYETSGGPAGLGLKATMLFQQHPRTGDHGRIQSYAPLYREQSYQTDGMHEMYPSIGSGYGAGPSSGPLGVQDNVRGDNGHSYRIGGDGRTIYVPYDVDGSHMVRRVRMPMQTSGVRRPPPSAANGVMVGRDPPTLPPSHDLDPPRNPPERVYIEERRRMAGSADEIDTVYASAYGAEEIPPLTTPDGRWRWDGRHWMLQR
ncbi:hypothetical protein M427DRAFT_51393 [Gonapodya prolifera JEL478]|uniref:Uncharacterized protein n=1 Tax=Gonapodya prolifera (strain JEL478) TaxID=1344416 RepID=A0A139AXC7_GONPJ|nr:hypothetical protein M427DRAFT_51393 [Gonapodya prolifera JEL478]|eukprot:KXS21115.1 hypothetical protein M427DRAFT_51393 [Gonapodya prolifera JEL478]